MREVVLLCMNSIQEQMLGKAEERLASMTRECSSYDEMKQAFLAESNQGQGLWLVSHPSTLSPAMLMQPRPLALVAPLWHSHAASVALRCLSGRLRAGAKCSCCCVSEW